MKERTLKIFKNADLSVLQKPSVLLLVFFACFSVWTMDVWRRWQYLTPEDSPFRYDVAQYYSYLPATFIYDYSFVTNHYCDGYNIEAPLGGRMPKTTYGMAIMYSPFYAIGAKVALNTGNPRDGFGAPDGECIHWGSIFYGLLGLLLLRNLLIKFYSEKVTTITIAIIFAGTNLLWYVVGDSEMTHGYLFMLISGFMLTTYHWYKNITWGRTLLLGSLIGVISLIRPTEILIGSIFIFWMVGSIEEAKERFKLLFKNYRHLFLIALMVILIWIPQFLFWKYKTGHYFFFSYVGERFFWGDPQILNILFSYRKGWFVYTPLIMFSFIGFFFMNAETKRSRPVFMILILTYIYILSCWWDWPFGGSFGARGFVQYYSFLAIPLAAFVAFIFEQKTAIRIKPLIQLAFCVIVFSGICLNVGQSYQYQQSYIHADGMTKKLYWFVFGKYYFSDADKNTYWGMVKSPDYDKLKSGENRNQ